MLAPTMSLSGSLGCGSMEGVVPASALSPSGDAQMWAALTARPRKGMHVDNRRIRVDTY